MSSMSYKQHDIYLPSTTNSTLLTQCLKFYFYYNILNEVNGKLF